MDSRQKPGAQGRDSIAFLSFRLDRRGGRLMRGDATIPLRPKTWAVLLHLAERPDVLVTTEELLDAVWPNVAVTPSTLTKSIGELRAALNDDARRPRCIETVHRRGFRFIAKTTAGAAGEPTPPTSHRDDSGRMFVGREVELRWLGELLAKAWAGERQFVLVTGEAGIGKTTLVEAFLDSPVLRAAPLPVWIAHGTCVEQQGAREAYMPLLDAVEGLAHRPAAERFVALLRRAAPTWVAQMPWLLDDDADAARRVLRIARPERMLREFAALTEAFTTDVTLVLVLEDLHWSDPSTVDLLSFLAQHHEPARLLVIGTYRPAATVVQQHVLSSAVQTLKSRAFCTELPLHDLSVAELQRYLELRFPGGDFVSALATKIHKYTDGTPLFVTSVVQHALRRGWILETEPGWGLAVPLEKLQLEVPDDTQQMIVLGFEGLSPDDRALLQAASVVGVEFDVPTVAAALAGSVDDVEARCEQLVHAQWLRRVAGSAEWPDGSTPRRYAFHHELYRHVAYAEVPEGWRQRLHQRVGEALENTYGERTTEIAAVLAVHFEHGHDYPRAVRYLGAAAALARQRFANREAISYLEDALAQLARLPDEAERHRQELGLRLALVPALSDLYGFASEQVRENCERAYEICVEVGSPEQRFQIMYTRNHLYWHRADKSLGPALLAELDDMAAHSSTSGHRLVVDASLVRAAFHRGRFIEACRLAQERLPAPREAAATTLPFVHGTQPLTMAHAHVALALWMLGYTARARKLMQVNLAAAREMGSPITLSGTLWFACLLEVWLRNTAGAHQLVEQTLALSHEQGFEHWSALASGLKGWVLVETGEVREGIETLERARAGIRATGGALMCTHMLAFQAAGHRRLGELDAALAAIDEALATAEATLDRSYRPELWRIKGELLLVTAAAVRSGEGAKATTGATNPRWHEAERCLLRALEIARECEAKALELRAATSLARAWQTQQRVPDARALLGEICRWFGSDDTNVDLTEAQSLSERLATSASAGAEKSRAS